MGICSRPPPQIIFKGCGTLLLMTDFFKKKNNYFGFILLRQIATLVGWDSALKEIRKRKTVKAIAQYYLPVRF